MVTWRHRQRVQQAMVYRLRVALGLCPECRQPAGIWTFCADCRAYHRLRRATWRAKHRRSTVEPPRVAGGGS